MKCRKPCGPPKELQGPPVEKHWSNPAMSNVNKTVATNVAKRHQCRDIKFGLNLGRKKCLISINNNKKILEVKELKLQKNSLNLKMKKFWLSPHLKSLSPHVANGDKVSISSTFNEQLLRQKFLKPKCD
jgi:hypothetical protein